MQMNLFIVLFILVAGLLYKQIMKDYVVKQL